ncbi:MAG: class I SAM-dependent methyltransferase [Promethearchaeota archaeon]
MKNDNCYNWDAKLYQKSSQYQFQLGLKAIEYLKPVDGENILDIGCGNALTTINIAKMIPNGRITGIEISKEMAKQARENLMEKNVSNVKIIQMNALDLDFINEFDAVFSNSAIHWILDQQSIYNVLFKALKNNGRLIVQTGLREVNIIFKVIKALESDPNYKPYFKSMKIPWSFLSAQETQKILEECGFQDIKVNVYKSERSFENLEALIDYFKAAALVPHLSVLPTELHDKFVNTCMRKFIELNKEKRFTIRFTRLYNQAVKRN